MEYGIIVIIVIVVIFLIGRELFCWYYKINERIELQKKTNDLLEKLIHLNGGDITINSNSINNDEIKLNKINISYRDIIGNIVKLDNLEIAENDYPNKLKWVDAKTVCRNMRDGWRLPTKEELNLLYINKNLIPNLNDNIYWTSTELDSKSAWFQNFRYGGQGTYFKDTDLNFRIVRSIN